MSNRPSIIERTAIWRRTAAATIAVLLLPATPLLQARSRRALGDSPGTEVWQRVNVTILARGSHVSGSTGNMDSYLALISNGRNHEELPARLVHYYAGFQIGINDERIMSSRAFRLRLTSASYCGMETKDFVVKHVFDAGAVENLQGALPCYLVRE